MGRILVLHSQALRPTALQGWVRRRQSITSPAVSWMSCFVTWSSGAGRARRRARGRCRSGPRRIWLRGSWLRQYGSVYIRDIFCACVYERLSCCMLACLFVLCTFSCMYAWRTGSSFLCFWTVVHVFAVGQPDRDQYTISCRRWRRTSA